jgi:hypothetical protein
VTFALSPWLIAAGAVVLAGLLFALNRLRTRDRVVPRATASLWQQAARAAPPAILVERFRRWLAYLLALAIALLLWFGAAGPRQADAPGDVLHVFYLDAAAPMLAGDAFAEARRALIADVGSVPAARRIVHVGDAGDSTVLLPGEPVSLLAKRLESVRAAPRASGFAAWVARSAPDEAKGRPIAIRYYGSASAAADARSSLPASTRLATGYLVAPVASNRGIVAFGASPAASGASDKADVSIEAVAADGTPIESKMLAMDEFGAAPVTPLGKGRFIVGDIPADGRSVTVSLPADAFPADDRATLTLPLRRPIRVALSPAVPETIRAVVRLDPGATIVAAAQADMIVRQAGETFGTGRPALILSDPGTQADTFVFGSKDTEDRAALADSLERLGLADLDAARLADDLRRPVAVGFRSTPVRTISVWGSLFDGSASFAGSRAMPLFVTQGIHWLAGQSSWIPYAQAAGPVSDQPGLVAPAPQTNGKPVEASLLDRRETLAAARPAPPADPADDARPGRDMLFTMLMALAAALLAVEWVLYRRGAMP